MSKNVDAGRSVWYHVIATHHSHTERVCTMNNIAYDIENEKRVSRKITQFFQRFCVGEILRKCNAYKEHGIPVITVFLYLFQLAFRNRSMYMDMQSEKAPGFCKDTIYRLKNSIHINWLRFTTLLSASVIKQAIEPLTDENRRSAFIIDDSIFERNRSKTVELLANVFDHAHHLYVRGFRMLTLGWSDGASFVPVNCCLLSTENQKNRINEAKQVNKQACGAKIRNMAQSKATEVLLQLIQAAQAAGIKAKYVLFDSWFTYPKTVLALKRMQLDTVAMVKKADNIRFLYQGEMLSNKEIFKRNKKRRGRANYLLSVTVEVCGEGSLPAKLVFVRNRNKKSDYLVLISTDTSLSEQEIIQLYGKRWDIEVFFKASKSVLKLTDECRSISYDAMCAQTAIVFARYIFLAVAMREEKDDRSIGPLFYEICDEIADITFEAALRKLQLFLDKLVQHFNAVSLDIRAFIAEFIANLPADLASLLDFNHSKSIKS